MQLAIDCTEGAREIAVFLCYLGGSTVAGKMRKEHLSMIGPT
jgi:hypothetical protein